MKKLNLFFAMLLFGVFSNVSGQVCNQQILHWSATNYNYLSISVNGVEVVHCTDGGYGDLVVPENASISYYASMMFDIPVVVNITDWDLSTEESQRIDDYYYSPYGYANEPHYEYGTFDIQSFCDIYIEVH
ncbi:MAG: hypothetical protein QG594_79 [Bacteroidota bacterium]|nr:hypothetical protein [Bacteroidota bacterium]